MTRLARAVWVELAAAYRAEAMAELAEVNDRRMRGQRHPIDDFLFQYYNLRPGQLSAWHPGVGVILDDAADIEPGRFQRRISGGLTLDVDAFLEKRGGSARAALGMLRALDQAPPRFGCFGMHEWAMVYGLAPGETRHPYLKLRFRPEQIAEIVAEIGCRCTHFDAFRFFTPEAKPLNETTPTRQTQLLLDQPGCLHANMDLYRWAGKLSPAVGSQLLLDTFRLARDIRVVDMAASAYDLSDWGLEPIRVETPEGRAAYVRAQRGFTQRAIPLRRQLIDVLESLLAAGAHCGNGAATRQDP